jgi:hypothetical protein
MHPYSVNYLTFALSQGHARTVAEYAALDRSFGRNTANCRGNRCTHLKMLEKIDFASDETLL